MTERPDVVVAKRFLAFDRQPEAVEGLRQSRQVVVFRDDDSDRDVLATGYEFVTLDDAPVLECPDPVSHRSGRDADSLPGVDRGRAPGVTLAQFQDRFSTAGSRS